MKANSASAVFQVQDLSKAIDYYISKLGFEEVFQYGEPPYYAGVKMNDVILHLCTSEENADRIGMGSVYIFCNKGIDRYYEGIVAKGVSITSKLETWPYAMRDFQIKDLDGNHLCFGFPVDPEKE